MIFSEIAILPRPWPRCPPALPSTEPVKRPAEVIGRYLARHAEPEARDLRPLDGAGLPTESAGLLGVLPVTAPSSVQRVVGAPSGRSAAVVFADGSAQVHPLPG